VRPRERRGAAGRESSARANGGKQVDELRQQATRLVDDFVAGTSELGPLARWISANTRRVNADGDDATRELVGNVRLTIDAFLHGRVSHQGARDHLARLLAAGRPTD
jgi:hypothetical protein